MHILFNVIGVLLWLGLIGQLAELAREPEYLDRELNTTAKSALPAPLAAAA